MAGEEVIRPPRLALQVNCTGEPPQVWLGRARNELMLGPHPVRLKAKNGTLVKNLAMVMVIASAWHGSIAGGGQGRPEPALTIARGTGPLAGNVVTSLTR
jgi:hypothetical protein